MYHILLFVQLGSASSTSLLTALSFQISNRNLANQILSFTLLRSYTVKSRNNVRVVGIATGLPAGRFGFRMPLGAKYLSPF